MKYIITVQTVEDVEGKNYPDKNTIYEQTVEVETSPVEEVIKAVNGL